MKVSGYAFALSLVAVSALFSFLAFVSYSLGAFASERISDLVLLFGFLFLGITLTLVFVARRKDKKIK